MTTTQTRSLKLVLAAVLTLPVITQAMASRSANPVATAAETAAETAAPNYDKPGFATRLHKGSLWVFEAGSDALAAFDAGSVPARHVVRPLAGPDNLTVRSPEGETITLYLTAKTGFHTRLRNERLWIFPEGAEALAAYDASGRVPARHVVRPLAGPMGLTIMAEEAETLDAYLAE